MYTVTPRTMSLKCHGAPLALVSDVVPLLVGATGRPSSPPPPGTSTRPHDGHVWLAPMSGGFQNLLQSLHHGNGHALHTPQARPAGRVRGAGGPIRRQQSWGGCAPAGSSGRLGPCHPSGTKATAWLGLGRVVAGRYPRFRGNSVTWLRRVLSRTISYNQVT